MPRAYGSAAVDARLAHVNAQKTAKQAERAAQRQEAAERKAERQKAFLAALVKHKDSARAVAAAGITWAELQTWTGHAFACAYLKALGEDFCSREDCYDETCVGGCQPALDGDTAELAAGDQR